MFNAYLILIKVKYKLLNIKNKLNIKKILILNRM